METYLILLEWDTNPFKKEWDADSYPAWGWGSRTSDS